MSAAPPSSTPPSAPVPATTPSTPDAGDVTGPPPTPAAAGRLVVLGAVALVVGIVTTVITLTSPFRDPIVTAILTVLAVFALVAGRMVQVRARRDRQPTAIPFTAFLLGVISSALLAISIVQTLFLFVFAERLEPEPADPAAIVQLQEDERRDLEASARMAVQTLDALRGVDDTYPTELAVTTRGDRLLTPEGVAVAGLPDGTEVSYQTFADDTGYELVLRGRHGGVVVADSNRGVVTSPPDATG